MSYVPTEWKSGDTVTSTKLNKMEQGISSIACMNILIVHEITENNQNNFSTHLDKTWEEMFNADVCFIVSKDIETNSSTVSLVTSISYFDGDYMVTADNKTYYASSPNDYLEV